MPRDLSRRTLLKSMCLGAVAGIPGLSMLLRRPAAHVPREEITDAERRAMASFAESFRHRIGAPGLSIAVARDGRVKYSEAFGTIGHDSHEPVTTASLFRIASVSKPITSAAIFSLIEAGRLRSDDTVFGARGVLGTRYGHPPYASGVERITVDHLLTHSSGGWGPEHDPMFHDADASQAELISWALDTQPPEHPPGTVSAYSNFGYCVLGRVIEAVSGEPYADYVQRRILSPSGVAHMRIARNSIGARAPNEVIYYAQDEGSSSSPYDINVSRMDSNGGWIATAADLARFASHVDGLDAVRNILQPDTIARMVAPSALNSRYARGWNVNAKGNWWHGGDLAGSSALLVRTSSHFCWAALANTRVAGSITALDDMMWELTSRVGAWKSA
jgi:CubicO group peptidase (beta-lactamase class C family)